MGLEHLIAVLQQGAEAEAAAILEDARAEAEAIRTGSETEVDLRRRDALAAQERDRRVAIEQARTAGERAARREILEARQRLLDRVFATAATRLPALLGESAYRGALPGLFTDAVACLGDRPGTARCHPGLRADLVRLARKGMRVTIVADPEVGSGFTLASDDGAMEVDATLEGRLARQAARLAVEVMARVEAGT